MSGGVLVVAEHVGGALRDVTRENVTAACDLARAGAGPVTVAVIAAEPWADLLAQAGLEGVDEILAVPVEQAEFDADSWVRAVEALVRDRSPSVVLAGFTVNGTTYGAAVAARLGLGLATDVLACGFDDGELVATRHLYGGKVEATLSFPDATTVLLLLRPTVWAPAEAGGGATTTTLAAIDHAPSRTRHLEYVEPPTSDVDIGTADLILSIGRGVGERENVARFEELAARMGMTFASSRPLVDAGWVPKERQVGQSGRTVKAKVYLAFGISGAAQHLAGIRGCDTVIAVNSDADAPIFGIAHHGAVADMFAVADELEALW